MLLVLNPSVIPCPRSSVSKIPDEVASTVAGNRVRDGAFFSSNEFLTGHNFATKGASQT